MEENLIELDCHVQSRPCQSAVERMVQLLQEKEPNSESHFRSIYELVGASQEDVFVFTSSGAEAIGQVIWSVFLTEARKMGKTQWIASSIEDAPLFQMLKRCEEMGTSVKIAPVDPNGYIDVEKIKELITPRTALISISMAQGLTGVIQPFEEIGKFAKEKGILFHLDVTYALGKIEINFAKNLADYLTFSGEMLHSVKGSGGVFAKKGVSLLPYVLGKGLDIPSLAALNAAALMTLLSLDTMGLETARLRDLFETEVVKEIPEAEIFFKNSLRLPNTSVISFPKVHADALEYFIRRKGLHPNQGGAYSQHLHKLLASSNIEGESALSFSLSRMTTEKDVMKAVSVLKEAAASLRKISEDLF